MMKWMIFGMVGENKEGSWDIGGCWPPMSSFHLLTKLIKEHLFHFNYLVRVTY